jgi:hypothetical protein
LNVYILLDRSGSMGPPYAKAGFWEETISSINGYVNELKGKIQVFVAAFDTLSYDVLRNVPLKEWTDIGHDELRPRGGTPLFDSAARLINRAFEDNPKRAQIVVVTDGDENSSRTTNQFQIKSLVQQVENRDWQVLFLGANFDKVGAVAASMAVHNDFTMPIAAGRMAGTMRGLATSTQAYFNSGEKFGLSGESKASAVADVSAPYVNTTVKAPKTKETKE